MQRTADRDHLITGIHCAGADRRDVLLLEFFRPLQERKVVFFVGGDDPQFDRSLSDKIAMDVADAVGDDVIVGDKPLPETETSLSGSEGFSAGSSSDLADASAAGDFASNTRDTFVMTTFPRRKAARLMLSQVV